MCHIFEIVFVIITLYTSVVSSRNIHFQSETSCNGRDGCLLLSSNAPQLSLMKAHGRSHVRSKNTWYPIQNWMVLLGNDRKNSERRFSRHFNKLTPRTADGEIHANDFSSHIGFVAGPKTLEKSWIRYWPFKLRNATTADVSDTRNNGKDRYLNQMEYFIDENVAPDRKRDNNARLGEGVVNRTYNIDGTNRNIHTNDFNDTLKTVGYVMSEGSAINGSEFKNETEAPQNYVKSFMKQVSINEIPIDITPQRIISQKVQMEKLKLKSHSQISNTRISHHDITNRSHLISSKAKIDPTILLMIEKNNKNNALSLKSKRSIYDFNFNFNQMLCRLLRCHNATIFANNFSIKQLINRRSVNEIPIHLMVYSEQPSDADFDSQKDHSNVEVDNESEMAVKPNNENQSIHSTGKLSSLYIEEYNGSNKEFTPNYVRDKISSVNDSWKSNQTATKEKNEYTASLPLKSEEKLRENHLVWIATDDSRKKSALQIYSKDSLDKDSGLLKTKNGSSVQLKYNIKAREVSGEHVYFKINDLEGNSRKSKDQFVSNSGDEMYEKNGEFRISSSSSIKDEETSAYTDSSIGSDQMEKSFRSTEVFNKNVPNDTLKQNRLSRIMKEIFNKSFDFKIPRNISTSGEIHLFQSSKENFPNKLIIKLKTNGTIFLSHNERKNITGENMKQLNALESKSTTYFDENILNNKKERNYIKKNASLKSKHITRRKKRNYMRYVNNKNAHFHNQPTLEYDYKNNLKRKQSESQYNIQYVNSGTANFRPIYGVARNPRRQYFNLEKSNSKSSVSETKSHLPSGFINLESYGRANTNIYQTSPPDSYSHKTERFYDEETAEAFLRPIRRGLLKWKFTKDNETSSNNVSNNSYPSNYTQPIFHWYFILPTVPNNISHLIWENGSSVLSGQPIIVNVASPLIDAKKTVLNESNEKLTLTNNATTIIPTEASVTTNASREVENLSVNTTENNEGDTEWFNKQWAFVLPTRIPSFNQTSTTTKKPKLVTNFTESIVNQSSTKSPRKKWPWPETVSCTCNRWYIPSGGWWPPRSTPMMSGMIGFDKK